MWSKAERRAWLPPVAGRPSQWAEAYRRLSRQQSARPGPWSHATAPYLRGLMDLTTLDGIEEVTIVKAAQVGVSEAIRNVVGWLADCEPDPVLLVLPSEDVGKKIMRRRMIPLFRDTPRLASLLTERSHDVALHSVTLANGFCVTLAWSGSPATLASDPVRLVVNDELDKFTAWSGKEADAVSLARMRTATFGIRRRVINVSTPTIRAGYIWSLWEQSPIRLRYFVPCPACQRYQWLTFDRLRWTPVPPLEVPAARAAWIETNGDVWYECKHCAAHWTEVQRVNVVGRGLWAHEEHTGEGLSADDTPIVRRDWPAGKRVAAHVSSLYCLWLPWRGIAAEHLRSLGSPALRQNFTNSWLGEVFEEQVQRIAEPVFAAKCRGGAAPHLVPNWATLLIGSADVQKDRLYWVVRAWGPGYRSQRVAHGIVSDFEELRQVFLGTRYGWVDPQRPAAAVALVGVDAGYRTQEVYRFALSEPTRVRALRGENEPTTHPIRLTRVTYRPPNATVQDGLEVWLHRVDTNHYKDRLAALVNEKTDAAGTGDDLWQLNREDDRDYNLQLASEHKVLLRSGRRGPTTSWQLVTAGAANHYLDAEVYQLALADMARVDLIQDERWPAGEVDRVQPRPVTPLQRPGTRTAVRRCYG